MSDWKSRATPVAANDWKSRASAVNAPIKTIDERTPYVSVADRAIAKNTAQSPEKQAQFIKLKYPELDVQVQDNDVLVKAKNETEYRKLDPSKLELEDITDLGDVVAGGITSTLGTAGGALLGALGGGVGALPGAAAGAAVAGGATEALRQKLGQALGIPQDVSGTDVALQAGLGGVGTALLGTGPAMKSAIKTLAAKQGITEEAAKALLESSGGIAKAYKNLPAKAAEYWFGAPSDVIKKYANDTQAVDELAKGSKSDYARELVDRIRLSLNQEKNKVGGMLSDEIGQSGKMIDLNPTIQSYQNHISKLQQEFDALPNAINKSRLDSAKEEFKAIFANAKSAVPEGSAPELINTQISPMQAWKLQDVFKEYGDLTRIGGGINSRFKNQATQAERDLADQALSAYQHINKSLDEATSGASQALKNEYSDLKRIQGNISPYLNTDQSAYTTFKNADSGAKTAFRESLEKLSQKTGENFKDDMLNLQAAEYFGSNALTPRSVGGVTSTSRTGPASVVGGILGSGLGGLMFGPTGAFGGAALGGAAGNLLASPLALKTAIKASAPIRQGVNAISPALFNASPIIRETINQTPWSQF